MTRSNDLRRDSRSMRAGRCCRALAHAGFAAAAIIGAPATGADDAGPAQPSARALVPSIVFDGTVLKNLQGGVRTGTTSVGNLHLKLTADGDAFGWPGFTAYTDVLTIRGGLPSNRAGDAQGVSNIEGPTGTQVEELWIQQNAAAGDSVLVGIYDLNSEFYRLQAAGLFQNSSFGIGPEFAQSGVEGPSIFPRTAAALRIAAHPTDNTVLRVAILDGVPIARPDGTHGAFRRGDGLLMVAEFALLTRKAPTPDRPPNIRSRIGRFSTLDPYDDKLAIGTWRYTRKFADLSEVEPNGQARMQPGSGAYLVGETALFGTGDPSSARTSAFVQLGYADPRVARFSRYVGAGVTAKGWGPFRPEDQWGFSVARAVNGSHYQRARAVPGAPRAETTFEITYLTQPFGHVAVQPDLQYVQHPNTNPSLANAWVAQVRFEIAF
ncbi:MAG: carbohydrate porin [Burkholderiaceae bacterium]